MHNRARARQHELEELETQILANMRRRIFETVACLLGIACVAGLLLVFRMLPDYLNSLAWSMGLGCLALAALAWRKGRSAEENARRQIERERSTSFEG